MRRIAIWGYFGGYGGIERMVYNFYKNIDRDKVQFDFVVPHDFGKIAFEDEILNMGGRVFRILYSERESLIKSRTCWIDYFKEHPEVVGIHVHAQFPYAFPLSMAKKAKVPLRIFHSHTSNGDYSKNIIDRVIKKIRQREIDTSATLYLACSDNAAKFMFPKKEYRWIKNGIEIEKFAFNKKSREEIRGRYGISKDDILLGTVGHLTDVKNPLYSIEILHECVKKNPSIKMVMVGEGHLKNELEKKIKEYGLERHVFFTGAVKDTSKWYQAFDLLLMPSCYEGFPVVLIEAQVAGLKCLVSDRITRDADVTGLIDFMSIDMEPTSWAKQIDKIMQEKNNVRVEYKEIVEQAGFGIKQVAKELEKIYLEI